MPQTGERPDIASAARGLAAALVETLHTRVELCSVELAEARLGLAQQALVATVALFCLGNGLVLAVLCLAWWAGPAWRGPVLGAAAALWLLAAAAGCWQWRRLQHSRPRLLHATLAQLQADVQALRRGGAAKGAT